MKAAEMSRSEEVKLQPGELTMDELDRVMAGPIRFQSYVKDGVVYITDETGIWKEIPLPTGASGYRVDLFGNVHFEFGKERSG